MKRSITERQSVLEALASLFPEASKTTLRSWLKEGRVEVDGIRVTAANTELFPGQVIAFGDKKKYIANGIGIIYEDQHIVVIDKPSGLLTVATAFEKEETAFHTLKQEYRPKTVHVVHRLDQDTSGVMLFALSEEARDRLKEIFEKHDIERSYTAVVEGRMDLGSSGTWKSYLHEDAQYLVHSDQNPSPGTKLAITHFSVAAVSNRYSLLRLTLETGRKNQIRVHCSEVGHPIVGDKKYGAHGNPIKRLCLHAHILVLRHPLTGKIMTFESPLPSPFHTLVEG